MKSLHKLRGMTGATALECAAVFRQQAAVIAMELHQRVQNGQSWHKYSPTVSQVIAFSQGNQGSRNKCNNF